jgi:hypothetical protein
VPAGGGVTGVSEGGTGESAGGGEVFVSVTVGSEVRVGVAVGSEVRVGSTGVLVAVLGTADGPAVVAVGEPVVGSAVAVSVVVGLGVWFPSGVGDMEEVGLGVTVLTAVGAGVWVGRGTRVGTG